MHEAGLPDGVINLVHGNGSGAGQALVDSADLGMVDKISFTGSTAVGKMIGETCGRNLVSASLELGREESACDNAFSKYGKCC